MREILCALITTYLIVLFARAIISWIPPSPGALATISRVLFDLTEPVLAPLRRVIPPAGVIDLSFLVLIIGVTILRTAVCG
ncbi:MAG: YggT family protein [Acidimicrobiia bacterium]